MMKHPEFDEMVAAGGSFDAPGFSA